MTNPVLPGTLTPLTPQLPATAVDSDISANRVVHFDETVRMVHELNSVLPNTHTNAIAAKEGADASAAARNAAVSASNDAIAAREASIAAKNAAEAAAANVGNPVAKSDKATATDVANGTADKWVDAARLKAGIDTRQPSGSYASVQSVSDLSQRVDSTATKTGIETLTNKTLKNAKETQTNLAAANILTPSTTSNATIRPTGAISFSGLDSTSNADVGKSMIAAITPSAAVTFTVNSAVKWPGSGAAPSLLSGRTYVLSLANMQVGSMYYWLANIAGPY